MPSPLSEDLLRRGVWKLTREDKLQLVSWMFNLPMEERLALAKERLAKAFPTAPAAMLLTAEHHLYVDGADDVLSWLADLARFLKSSDKSPPEDGHTYSLMHHVYNWWQFKALLPAGTPTMLEVLKDIRTLIQEGSYEAALGSAKVLEEMIEGNEEFPQING